MSPTRRMPAASQNAADRSVNICSRCSRLHVEAGSEDGLAGRRVPQGDQQRGDADQIGRLSNRSTRGISIAIPVSASAVLMTSSRGLSDSRGMATPASLAVPMSNVASAFGLLAGPVHRVPAEVRELEDAAGEVEVVSTVACACRAA